MKCITVFVLLITVFINKTATGQTLEFGNRLSRSLDRLISFEDYFFVDSNAYYFAFIKVEIDKRSKVSGIQFSDAVSDSINVQLRNKIKQYPDVLHKLDSVAKISKLKNCTLLFPVTFSPGDYLIPHVNRTVIENDKLLRFGGQYISGNIIVGRTLTLGWVFRKLS